MPNKLSGIYRIYLTSIENPKVQYSYIGISKDIRTRVSTHFAKLKRYVKDPKKLKMTLSTKNIPISSALYHKWALIVLLLEIDLSNFKWEILVEKNFQKTDNLEIEEMNYIDKYNSELMGLNGIFAKHFKAWEEEIWTGKLSSHTKKVLRMSSVKWKKYEEILKKDIKKALPWVPYQMELMLKIKLKGKIIYEEFIEKMLIKFSKRENELIEVANSKKRIIFKNRVK